MLFLKTSHKIKSHSYFHFMKYSYFAYIKRFKILADFISQPVRGGSRAVATFTMENFVIIVNGSKPLSIITKSFILDVAAVLDPPLASYSILAVIKFSDN